MSCSNCTNHEYVILASMALQPYNFKKKKKKKKKMIIVSFCFETEEKNSYYFFIYETLDHLLQNWNI